MPYKDIIDNSTLIRPATADTSGAAVQTSTAASGADTQVSQPVAALPPDPIARMVESKGNGFTMNSNAVGQHYADWGKTPFLDAIKDASRGAGKHTIAENWSDYNKWAKENGKEPLDILIAQQAMAGKDIGKSWAGNEAEDRKLRRQQRWEQIGNVLNHLGNFVGALKGAPAAKYESGAELTKRQQAVKDAVVKQRGDPKDILAQIWKQRADERAHELNAANIALREAQKATEGARKVNIEGKTSNDAALAAANVALKGAQQHQSETGAARNEAQEENIRTKTKYIPQEQSDKHKVASSTVAKNNSATKVNNARAAGVQKNNAGEYVVYDKNGKARTFKTYSSAKYFSQQQGTWVNDYAEESDSYGGTSKKVKGGHSQKPGKKNTGVSWKK